jgi:hypothetical protein
MKVFYLWEKEHIYVLCVFYFMSRSLANVGRRWR